MAQKRGREEKRRGANRKRKKEKPRFLFLYLFLCGEFYVKNRVKKRWREDDKNDRGGV